MRAWCEGSREKPNLSFQFGKEQINPNSKIIFQIFFSRVVVSFLLSILRFACFKSPLLCCWFIFCLFFSFCYHRMEIEKSFFIILLCREMKISHFFISWFCIRQSSGMNRLYESMTMMTTTRKTLGKSQKRGEWIKNI